MLLYHGSNLIVDKPKLIEQTRGLDFGVGFYLTSRKEQAVRFSEIVVDRRKSGIATVSVFNFNEELAETSLNVHRFIKANNEWLRFVADNRLKAYIGEVYDIVVGPVANDTVMPTIQAFLSGFLNEEATIITLKTSKLFDQWCFKSEKSLSLLSFVSSYEFS
ncbi:MAG: DUF3990 domain-containing protein [Oscillospiraceae bacterium]|jgi:hypothetical protein|nr:DUF3990 domain-containing protein [Oscillospiraceae bacterium]